MMARLVFKYITVSQPGGQTVKIQSIAWQYLNKIKKPVNPNSAKSYYDREKPFNDFQKMDIPMIKQSKNDSYFHDKHQIRIVFQLY